MVIRCVPIFPTPTTPSVLFLRSNPLSPSSEKLPRLVCSMLGMIFLEIARINAMACSATVFSPYDGTLHTVMPSLAQAARSIWSYPVDMVHMSLSFGIWVSSCAVIGE